MSFVWTCGARKRLHDALSRSGLFTAEIRPPSLEKFVSSSLVDREKVFTSTHGSIQDWSGDAATDDFIVDVYLVSRGRLISTKIRLRRRHTSLW